MHTDIKPENILYNFDQEGGGLRFVIADLGNAIGEQAPVVRYRTTRYYRAPELLFDDGQVGIKSDVWALG